MAYYTALMPHWPWVPTPHSADQQVPDLNETRLGDPKYHPDMINYLDRNVGRLLKALERLGIAKNTIVVFCHVPELVSGLAPVIGVRLADSAAWPARSDSANTWSRALHARGCRTLRRYFW